MPPSDKRTSPSPAIRTTALLAVWTIAALFGGVFFVGLMRTATLLGPGVIFYRGLVALALTALVLLALFSALLRRLPRLGLGFPDALGAAVVATSVLLAAFVLGPVTVDRSVSVFMLAQFDAAPGPLTEAQAREKFVKIYAGEWDQVGRRLKEQELSGNLERAGDAWRLTAQGKGFMDIARRMSWIFGGDPRFVGRQE